MLDVNLEFYLYSTLIMLFLAMASITLVVRNISGEQLPFVSIKLFFLYFALGLVGFLIQGIRYAAKIHINYTVNLVFYVVCSFILFISVTECIKRKNSTFAVSLVHIAIVIGGLFLPDVGSIIIYVSIYAFSIYSIIAFISYRRAWREENIGNGIIGFAALGVTITSLVQLYVLFVLANIHLAYYLVATASAAGFLLVGIGFLSTILIAERKKLTSVALRDPLTALLNRRGMYNALHIPLHTAKRYGGCISAIAVDIDYFKRVNDQYGHDAGDRVLREIAMVLSKNSRNSDACCRLGGEEFVIVLTNTTIEGALLVAERVRKSIEALEVDGGGGVIKVTASFGVASRCKQIDLEDLLIDADKALYAAKAGGRNRVCRAGDVQ